MKETESLVVKLGIISLKLLRLKIGGLSSASLLESLSADLWSALYVRS
jgi:hypothetical protein